MGGIGLVIVTNSRTALTTGRNSIPKAICAIVDREDGKSSSKRKLRCDEYSSFIAVDDLKLNGRLTLGENTATTVASHRSDGAATSWPSQTDLTKR